MTQNLSIDMEFLDACRDSNLDKIQQLNEKYLENNYFPCTYQQAFTESCLNGKLEVIKLLRDINGILLVNIHPWYHISSDNELFLSTCIKGQLEVAKWLWDITEGKILKLPDDDIGDPDEFIPSVISEKNPLEDLYEQICFNGHLEVIKWLWEVIPDELYELYEIDYEYLFYILCENGHLEIAKWIYEIGSFEILINEHMKTFEIVCKNGYFYIAKWLWECTNFDVNPDRAFCKASEMGYLDIVRFLVSVKPERYQIGENNETMIIKFNFPKTQANCIICYDDKTCYQVSCCQKEICHECLEQIADTRCPHCRDPNCL